MDFFISQIISGLSITSILLMIALGLAIIYGTTGVINMAHGEFVMIGAYT
jgi:urea transport system permease protein